MALSGERQDYTFKRGVTYYVGETVQLHGKTTIQGGAVIKFGHQRFGGLPEREIRPNQPKPFLPVGHQPHLRWLVAGEHSYF